MIFFNRILANYHYAMFGSMCDKNSKDAMKHFNKALYYERKLK